MKRYIALLLSVLIAFSSMNLVFAESQTENFVKLSPTDDTSIRANQADTNFGEIANLYLDVRSGSRRYSLIRYDANEKRPEIDTATKIMFRFYTGQEERCKRTLLYGLYGAHKSFDENTLTWKKAAQMVEQGVSLTDYFGAQFETPIPPSGAKWHEIDVTDYVKSQSDYIYAFKVFAAAGSTNSYALRSKEAVGFEPHLVIYTDIEYEVNMAADQLEMEYRMSALTNDIDLPSQWGNCNVEWESKDESIITDHGRIGTRPPLAEDKDKITTMMMRVSLDARTVEREITVRVLREGVFPADWDTYTSGGMNSNTSFKRDKNLFCSEKELPEFDRKAFLRFSILDEEARLNAEKVILRLYPDHMSRSAVGEFQVSMLEGELKNQIHEDLTYNMIGTLSGNSEKTAQGSINGQMWVDIDVTEYVKGQQDGICAFRLDGSDEGARFFSKDSDYAPQIILLNADSALLYTEGASLNLGDLNAVTNDLVLPNQTERAEVIWESNHPEFIDSNGWVTRPTYEDSDQTIYLTATVTDGTAKAYYQFKAIVLKQETGSGPLGFRELKDPMKLSDEAFFGVWDDNRYKWSVKPTIRYTLNDELKAIEDYVKINDYESAKAGLLEYYRARPENNQYEVKPSVNYNLDTALAVEGVIGNQSSAADFTLGNTMAWTEIDLTSNGTVDPAYMLFDRSKNGSTAVFASRESSHKPYIEVVADGKKVTLPCVADTYLQAGENNSVNYGRSTILYAYEEEEPFGEETKRAYLNFDTSAFTGNEDIQSIKLYVYGMKMGGPDEDMNLLVYKSPLLSYMDEYYVTWNDHTPGTFNFSGYIYDWAAPYGAEFEWINSLARLNQNSSMVSYYLGTNDVRYAYRAIENVMNIYTYQTTNYPRDLDTAWRVPNMLATMFGLINSDVMTPEVFTAMLKYSYQIMEIMKTATAGTLNQRNAMEVSFLRLVAYFPELRDSDYMDLAKQRVSTTLLSAIMYDDGSYKEATSGYVLGVLKEIVEALKILKRVEGSVNPELMAACLKLATYYANLAFPDGYMVPYGDGGRVSGRSGLRALEEFLENNDLKFIQSGGTEGTEPEYSSRSYPTKKIVMMRNSWDKNGLAAFINAETGGSHGHPDDLHLDLYAYGSCLLADAGNGGGYNPNSPAGYVRTSTWAHNTVEIDGLNQGIVNSAGVSGMDFKTNGVFDFVNAYTKATEGVTHTRKVLFIRDSHWIVTDYLEPTDNNEHSYKQIWHPDNYNNLTLDEVTGTMTTNFSEGANLQIVQASPEKLTAEKDQSYIKNKHLINLMEDYVSYEQTAVGTAVYDTILYPTPQGVNKEVTAEQLPLSDGATPEIASAVAMDFGDSLGVYYISHEAMPKLREFGDYQFSGGMLYMENHENGSPQTLALQNAKELYTTNGKAILKGQTNIGDLGIKWSGNTLELETSGNPNQVLEVYSPIQIKQVTLNGNTVNFTQTGETVTVYADDIQLDAVMEGIGKVAVCQEKIIKTVPITVGGKTENVTVEIPAGTKVSGPHTWNGKIDFYATEDGTMNVHLGGENSRLTFSKPVILTVPFYKSNGAYYLINGQKNNFSTMENGAEISNQDNFSVIKTTVGGKFVLTVRIGAITAGSSGGGGGGFPGGKGEQPVPKPSENPTLTLLDINGHWAEGDIMALFKNGVVKGDENGNYNPDSNITRVEFVAILERILGLEQLPYSGEYKDVAQDAWYADVVETAKQSGLISGYEDKTFRPNEIITREAMAKIIVNAYVLATESVPEGEILSGFSDYIEISHWALDYFEKAYRLGLIRGITETEISPKSGATRAQAAAVAMRFYNLVSENK